MNPTLLFETEAAWFIAVNVSVGLADEDDFELGPTFGGGGGGGIRGAAKEGGGGTAIEL